MPKKPFPTGSEKKFNEFLVSEYLKLGSVDETLKEYRYGLPISYAGYQRVLDKWGIVKAAGPNNKFGETADFITKLVYDNVPFEKLYKKMPFSFKTSAATLYRILSYIKEGITRRLATGLVVTPYGKENKVLVAKDYSLPRVDLGKRFGCVTIPISFSRIRDPREDAILRVLQQEVFTDLAIKRKLSVGLIPKQPKPFMFLDIADVRVEVFRIKLPQKLSQTSHFSSFRLTGYEFVDVKEILAGKVKDLRIGVFESIKGYKKFRRLKKKNLSMNPLQGVARVNSILALSEEA